MMGYNNHSLSAKDMNDLSTTHLLPAEAYNPLLSLFLEVNPLMSVLPLETLFPFAGTD